ncbi:MAG: DNA gyrase subunit A [Anaerolineales bacterium]|nr:MAG: DNA gyrase subunit A [Anaerolineales bacterium]
MEIGTVRLVDINVEMQEAYLDYAMSVIVSRALPDVRDGLKPVHRRILYAMHDMGLRPNTPYKKSARIVGEVLGKYHPHGDQAVYEAMVRMAQDFSMRYMLVDGQGNFGSIDGDSPAAMRYTEARLWAMAEEMLADIHKETVDFGPNFDGTLTEPLVLPSAFPNLLVNGSSGIAVGMTTNIPPHNLGEVCDALVYMIDRYKKLDDISAEDLMQFIQGPDFPTGGIVYRYGEEEGDGEQPDLIHSAYALGRGRITVQAKTHIEEMSRSRHRIVVTELPYQVNKSRLIERIAELARDGRVEGIADLRDESDRQGMRLVIELTRTVEPRQVLGRLFKLTPLQDTFSIRMLALVKREPRLLPLKRALQHYIEHRLEIIARRSRYELDRAKERAHILQGLLKALAHLDEVIATIRRSRDVDRARANLRRKFKFSQVQAQAILDMPLRRLAALERKKLEQEYKEKQKIIKYLQGLLRSPRKMLALVKEELLELKEKYGDARRTQIVEREKGELTARDLLPEEEVLISITRGGVIKREPVAGKRKIAPKGQGKNATQFLLLANTRDDLAFFTAGGHAGLLPVHQIPDVAQRRAGTPVTGLWPLGRKKLTAVVALPGEETEEQGGYLVLATRDGKIKRITLADFVSAAAKGEVTAMGVDHSDELRWARLTQGGQEIILVTKNGQAIRFSEKDVRPMGLAAAGVMAIKLAGGDQIAAMDLVQPRAQLLVATTRGYAKRTPLADFPVQKRYGSGVVAAQPSSRVGEVAAAKVAYAKDKVAFVSAKGTIRGLTVQSVERMSRSTQGKAVMKLKDGDSLADIVALEGSPVTEE